jgi:hypothetical protein
VQAGLGLGLGVQGQAELGLGGHGVQGRWVREFLTSHRSHCSKTLISATAPQPPPLKLICITPPPDRRPHRIIITRGQWYTFCTVYQASVLRSLVTALFKRSWPFYLSNSKNSDLVQHPVYSVYSVHPAFSIPSIFSISSIQYRYSVYWVDSDLHCTKHGVWVSWQKHRMHCICGNKRTGVCKKWAFYTHVCVITRALIYVYTRALINVYTRTLINV